MNTYHFKSFSEISSTISTPASVHTTEDITGICRSYTYLPRNTQHPISASNFRAREGGWISPSPSACSTIKLLKRCSRRKSLLSQSRCTSNVGVFSCCFGICACAVTSWAMFSYVITQGDFLFLVRNGLFSLLTIYCRQFSKFKIETKADVEFGKINPGTTHRSVLLVFSRLFFKQSLFS